MKKLSVWARENNITYLTAYRWLKEGKMPVKTTRTSTGGIYIIEEEKPKETDYTMKELIEVVKEILKEIKK